MSKKSRWTNKKIRQALYSIKQSVALKKLVQMSEEDYHVGKVMSSEEFKSRLTKRKVRQSMKDVEKSIDNQ